MGQAKSGYALHLICGQIDVRNNTALTKMASDNLVKHMLLDLISTKRPVTAAKLQSLSDVDWHSACAIAKQHRIGPMLHNRIALLGLAAAVPLDVRDQWAGAYRKAAFRYLSFRKTLALLNHNLDTAQFPYAALKGAWLSQYVYDNPVLRPLRDIDILVEPSSALAVYAVLEKNGFVRRDDFPMPLDGALNHAKHLPPMRCTDTGVYVEVHTRLMDAPPRSPVKHTLDDVPLLLERCEYHDGVPYLSPTDTLLHLIIHAAYDHQFNNGPLTFNDIAFLLESAPIDWPRFWAMAHAGNWARGCIMILELASFYHGAEAWREFYETGFPAPSLRQLENAALLSLQDYDHRGVIGLKAAIAGDTSWLGKARLLFNRAFPPLHRLAAFSGAATASYWSILHYPGWLVTQMHRMIFVKTDADVMQDIDRAKDVRNWIYGKS